MDIRILLAELMFAHPFLFVLQNFLDFFFPLFPIQLSTPFHTCPIVLHCIFCHNMCYL